MLPSPIRRRRFWEDPFGFVRAEFPDVAPMWDRDSGENDLVVAYPVDVSETDKDIVVEAELPGFTKDEVNVTLEKGVLTISAERKEEEAEGEKRINERRYTRVQRSFTLPVTVEDDKVNAKLENGVLKLTLPKAAESVSQRIAIK